MYLASSAYQVQLEAHGREWLDESLGWVSDRAPATGSVRRDDSTVERLIDAVIDPNSGEEAALIVIGTSRRGAAGLFAIGTVAAALLHSAPVPVVLALAGYEARPEVTRLSCATDVCQSSDALVDVAAESAAGRSSQRAGFRPRGDRSGRFEQTVGSATAVHRGHGEQDAARTTVLMVVVPRDYEAGTVMTR